MEMLNLLKSNRSRGFLLKLLTWDLARQHLIHKIEEGLYQEYMKKDPNRFPRKVQEDKFLMVRTMIRGIDRGLKEGLISRNVWPKFINSFLSIYSKNKEKIESFVQEYGQKPPGFLTLSPTHLCNLKCEGCYANSYHQTKEALPFSISTRIIAEQKDLWSSHFTVISGGEPLIYKSEGRDIFDLFADHPDTFFLMYTNGTLIDANTAKKLAEVGNVTPAISVEGFEEETDRRRGQGVFKKILHAMENLRQEGVPFGISITAMRHNAELILSEEFIDFYFNKQGALYGWIFQYMPIGRRFTLDLQVTPQQRKWMLEKTWSYIHEQNLFLADFWNCGAVSNGCISAGKPGGYLYIDWNGNVMPCVFNPYTLDNIITIYNQGGNLNQVLLSPLFTRIREWQEKYALQGPPDKMGNILRPCVIRDHYQIMRQIIDETKAKPADEPAAQALQDKDYYVGLLAYDKELQRELDPLWEKNYLKPEKRQQAYA